MAEKVRACCVQFKGVQICLNSASFFFSQSYDVAALLIKTVGRVESSLETVIYVCGVWNNHKLYMIFIGIWWYIILFSIRCFWTFCIFQWLLWKFFLVAYVSNKLQFLVSPRLDRWILRSRHYYASRICK